MTDNKRIAECRHVPIWTGYTTMPNGRMADQYRCSDCGQHFEIAEAAKHNKPPICGVVYDHDET